VWHELVVPGVRLRRWGHTVQVRASAVAEEKGDYDE